MAWLPECVKIVKICLFVLTKCTNLIDTHTHRHDIGRACIASRGKNKTETILEKKNEHHRLRSSASTVLTATGQVNGRWRTLTPTESKPLSPLQQNLAQLIMSATGPHTPNLVQIHPLQASGQMGEILCLFIYLFIYTFFLRLAYRLMDFHAQ